MTFSKGDRVTVRDNASPDNGRSGTVDMVVGWDGVSVNLEDGCCWVFKTHQLERKEEEGTTLADVTMRVSVLDGLTFNVLKECTVTLRNVEFPPISDAIKQCEDGSIELNLETVGNLLEKLSDRAMELIVERNPQLRGMFLSSLSSIEKIERK